MLSFIYPHLFLLFSEQNRIFPNNTVNAHDLRSVTKTVTSNCELDFTICKALLHSRSYLIGPTTLGGRSYHPDSEDEYTNTRRG